MNNPDIVCLASWNVDLVSRVARPVARGETLMASSFDISPGGKGSNAAVAAARQGARVALVARIGDDESARSTKRRRPCWRAAWGPWW
jgi:ribokinase